MANSFKDWLRNADVGDRYVIANVASRDAYENLPGRGHWGIEIMHRDKDVALAEDRYTTRSDHAPAFSCIDTAQMHLKSPPEQYRNRAASSQQGHHMTDKSRKKPNITLFHMQLRVALLKP